MFIWNEDAFIKFLGTRPFVHSDELSTIIHFNIRRGMLTLNIAFDPTGRDVEIRLFNGLIPGFESLIFEAAYMESPGGKVVSTSSGDYLEIGGPNAFEGVYDGQSALKSGVRIRLEPRIQIKPFWY